MPYRVNGCGVWYVGKRNVEQYQQQCEFCHQLGAIQSYDTRLWVTVVFVPIIPLGRKRIIGECPVCRRHRAVSAHEWERIKAETTSEALAAVKADEQNVDKAVELHGTLVAFGEREQAKEIANFLLDRHADNTEVLFYLGAWYERLGDADKADELFQRALKQDPDNPHARRAVAVGQIQKGELDEAEATLAPLRPPSKDFDPGAFFALAEARRTRGQHERAAEILQLVQEAHPEAAKDKVFRKAAQATQKQLGTRGAIVPETPLYRQGKFLWMALAAALIGVLLGLNYYRAHHRQAFLLNGLSVPLTVELDDQSSQLQVAAYDIFPVKLSEGQHRVRVTAPGGFPDPLEFTIDGSIGTRWWNRVACTIDPARSAVVNWERNTYAMQEHDRAYTNTLFLAQPYRAYDGIDYPFEDFPDEVDLPSTTATVDKTALSIWKSSPSELAILYPQLVDDPAVLDLFEAHLRCDEQTRAMLSLYLESAQKHHVLDRCYVFLKSDLERRPIDVEWHRSFQTVADLTGRHEEIVPEYDRWIQADSDNADLLYLRARLEPYTEESLTRLDQALQADPDHQYALLAKGSEYLAVGDFAKAQQIAEQALATNPEHANARDVRRSLLFAQGEYQKLRQELLQAIADSPFDISAQSLLLRTEIQLGNDASARQHLEEFATFIRNNWPSDPHELVSGLQYSLATLQGDAERARPLAQGFDSPDTRARALFGVELLAGDLEAAGQFLEQTPEVSTGFDYLTLSLAYHNQNQAQESHRWFQQALKKFTGEGYEERLAADLLTHLDAEGIEKLMHIYFQPADKAILLAVLPSQSAEVPDEVLELAEKLNFELGVRHTIVEQALKNARSLF